MYARRSASRDRLACRPTDRELAQLRVRAVEAVEVYLLRDSRDPAALGVLPEVPASDGWRIDAVLGDPERIVVQRAPQVRAAEAGLGVDDRPLPRPPLHLRQPRADAADEPGVAHAVRALHVQHRRQVAVAQRDDGEEVVRLRHRIPPGAEAMVGPAG